MVSSSWLNLVFQVSCDCTISRELMWVALPSYTTLLLSARPSKFLHIQTVHTFTTVISLARGAFTTPFCSLSSCMYIVYYIYISILTLHVWYLPFREGATCRVLVTDGFEGCTCIFVGCVGVPCGMLVVGGCHVVSEIWVDMCILCDVCILPFSFFFLEL